jgi:hypothetical protein
MVRIEVSGQRLGQIGDLVPHPTLRLSASRNGSDSPLIIAVSIARADTVFKLDTTDESLMLASVHHEALLFEWR